MPEPITLLEDASPTAQIAAVVETDGTTVYLYLHGGSDSDFGTRALWIANLAPAPDGVDVERMKRGEAPMMPAGATEKPQGLRLTDLEPLKLVWFTEGTGVALLGKDGLLGVIPPGTTDTDNFPGFARDCAHATKLAWPLNAANAVTVRHAVGQLEKFWDHWEAEEAWPQRQEALLAAIDSALGNDGRYFAIDGGEWPPRFLAIRRTGGNTVLITGGVSTVAQPGVAQPMGRAKGPRRFELGLALAGEHSEESLQALARYVAAQSKLPWMRNSWLGPGHTLGCELLPVGHSGVRFPAVLCAENVPGAPAVNLPPLDGEPVSLLWLVPITAAERALAVQKGSAALFAKLSPLGPLWPHRDRADSATSN